MIAKLELHCNTGESGTQKWITYEGIVYDVTDFPRAGKRNYTNACTFPARI